MPDLAGYPRGLLSLLDSQNFGENPRALIEAVNPVIELADMYACSKQVLIAGTNAAATTGFNSCANGLGPVPGGEVWRVVGVGFVAVTGAGVTADGVAPSIQKDGADFMLLPTIPLVASKTAGGGGALTCPLYVTGGMDIGLKALGVAGGTFTAAVQVLFSRLRA